jgi:transposase InsO family protein
LKWLSIVDEFTRECLALEVERGMGAADVAEVLIELFTTRGVPGHIRSDNGGEFIAATIRRLATLTGVENLYIAIRRPRRQRPLVLVLPRRAVADRRDLPRHRPQRRGA